MESVVVIFLSYYVVLTSEAAAPLPHHACARPVCNSVQILRVHACARVIAVSHAFLSVCGCVYFDVSSSLFVHG